MATSTPDKKPEFMQIEDANDEFEKGFFRGPALAKFKQNPIAFIAIGVTVVFLGKAVTGAGGQKNKTAAAMNINRNLRNRVKAQGFAIAAIAGAYYLSVRQQRSEDDR